METNTTTKAETMKYQITTEAVAEERINNWGDRKADATIRKHEIHRVTDSNGKLVAIWNGSLPLRFNNGSYKRATSLRMKVLPNQDFNYPLDVNITPVKNEDGKRTGFKAVLKNGTVITGKNPAAVWENLIATQYSL